MHPSFRAQALACNGASVIALPVLCGYLLDATFPVLCFLLLCVHVSAPSTCAMHLPLRLGSVASPWLELLTIFLCWAPARAQYPPVEDAWTFRTRPDIEAPRFRIVLYNDSLIAPGYWFIASYDYLDESRATGGHWTAPQIYDGSGGLIWSGSVRMSLNRRRETSFLTWNDLAAVSVASIQHVRLSNEQRPWRRNDDLDVSQKSNSYRHGHAIQYQTCLSNIRSRDSI